MDDLRFHNNDKWVDIHGREIPTMMISRNKEAVLLSDLRQTGVSIFRNNQYAKLSKTEKEFDVSFMEHMLESAKTYMLNNKIKFSHDEIIGSIENCKHVLSNSTTAASSNFFKNRTLEVSDDEIRVCFSSTPKDTLSPIPKPKVFKQPKQSPDSSFDNSFKKNTPKKDFNSSFNTKNRKHEKKNEQKLKKFEYNTDVQEIDVIVTHVDKSNCCWVRDKEKSKQMEMIHKRVNAEAKHQKFVRRKEMMMDKVYMAVDEGEWARCKIVKITPLTVIFMDYGHVTEVAEIRNISDELAEIPSFVMRITFKEREYKAQLNDEIRIKPFMRNADGTYFVNVLKKLTPDNSFSSNCQKSEAANLTSFSSNSQKTSPFAKLRSSNPQKTKVEEDHSPSSNFQKTKPEATSVNLASFSSNSQRTKVSAAHLTDKIQKMTLEEPEEAAFFTKPPPLCTLQGDQKVVIIHEEDGNFYLRSAECVKKLRTIEQEIDSFSGLSKAVPNLKLDQIVLFRNNKDGKHYRAIVNKIILNNIGIELLDYVDSFTVNKNSLRSISEELSKEPVTFIEGGKLLGFENGELNTECKDLVREYIKKEKKFVVSLGFDDELDLCSGTTYLSEELQKLTKTKTGSFPETKDPHKVHLKDIKTYKPELGVATYVCGSYNNPNELSLIPADEFLKHANYILRSEIEDEEQYEPSVQEVCLCYYLGYWYRCVVTRIFDKECEVLLLDFGSIHLIKKEDMRKPDEHVTEIPALGLPSILINIPEHQNAEAELKNLVLWGEVYTVDIKRISNGKCHVEIPLVYAEIR